MNIYELMRRGKKSATPATNGKCKVVMASSYLERPLRTLEQVLDERASRRAPTPAARYADPHISGPDSIELLARALTEDANQDGAGQRSSLRRRRAA